MAYIKDHPNCKPGDCYNGECHVVSCAIYQGYEEPEIVSEDETNQIEEQNVTNASQPS
ncbi:MAG: hypothetical protein K0R72_1017 [Clostridia bacterium]|jgi:hypothetical protein|nr:hypothetical protein [Clostridia bacterium]